MRLTPGIAPQMAAVKPPAGKVGVEEEEVQLRRLRMVLTSTNVKNLEKGVCLPASMYRHLAVACLCLLPHTIPHTACREFVEKAKAQEIKVRGPVRMPVKTLRITTRKTPNGEGTKTWDRYEMRIYKRILDFQSQFESLKSITDIMYVVLLVVYENVLQGPERLTHPCAQHRPGSQRGHHGPGVGVVLVTPTLKLVFSPTLCNSAA